MYEKISEQHIRDEKIQKLKEKILSEINKRSENNKKELYVYINPDTALKLYTEDYERVIKEEYNLLQLKEFINNETLNDSSLKEPKCDLIIYYISLETIDLWLQEKYSFVTNFLTQIEYERYPVSYILNVKFLGSQFTNIFDIVAYKDKKEKENQ